MTADDQIKYAITMHLDEMRFTISSEGGRMVLPEDEVGLEPTPEGQPQLRFVTFTMEELRRLMSFLLDSVPDPHIEPGDTPAA